MCFVWDLKKLLPPTFHQEELPKNNHSNSQKEKEAGYLQFWDIKEEITMDIHVYKLELNYEIGLEDYQTIELFYI